MNQGFKYLGGIFRNRDNKRGPIQVPTILLIFYTCNRHLKQIVDNIENILTFPNKEKQCTSLDF